MGANFVIILLSLLYFLSKGGALHLEAEKCFLRDVKFNLVKANALKVSWKIENGCEQVEIVWTNVKSQFAATKVSAINSTSDVLEVRPSAEYKILVIPVVESEGVYYYGTAVTNYTKTNPAEPNPSIIVKDVKGTKVTFISGVRGRENPTITNDTEICYNCSKKIEKNVIEKSDCLGFSKEFTIRKFEKKLNYDCSFQSCNKNEVGKKFCGRIFKTSFMTGEEDPEKASPVIYALRLFFMIIIVLFVTIRSSGGMKPGQKDQKAPLLSNVSRAGLIAYRILFSFFHNSDAMEDTTLLTTLLIFMFLFPVLFIGGVIGLFVIAAKKGNIAGNNDQLETSGIDGYSQPLNDKRTTYSSAEGERKQTLLSVINVVLVTLMETLITVIFIFYIINRFRAGSPYDIVMSFLEYIACTILLGMLFKSGISIVLKKESLVPYKVINYTRKINICILTLLPFTRLHAQEEDSEGATFINTMAGEQASAITWFLFITFVEVTLSSTPVLRIINERKIDKAYARFLALYTGTLGLLGFSLMCLVFFPGDGTVKSDSYAITVTNIEVIFYIIIMAVIVDLLLFEKKSERKDQKEMDQISSTSPGQHNETEISNISEST